MLLVIAGLLVLLIGMALMTFREGYDPSQKTFASNADRLSAMDQTYLEMDKANLAINSRKAIGPDVTAIVTSTTKDSVVPRSLGPDYDPRRTPISRRGVPGTGDRSSSSSMGTCESLNNFMLRETAISNMMGTNLTAEQRMQSQKFMNLLNDYIAKVQRTAPLDATNWSRVALTRDDIVPVVVDYARGKDDADSKKLVQAFDLVQNNATMTAYIKSMLLVADMTDAYHDCNGSAIRTF
jgi:hypothetical protein